MSDMELYKILENFDNLESGRDKLTQVRGWTSETVFGSDRDGGSQEFEIEFRTDGANIVEIKWPDETDFMPEREVYWDEEDIIGQLTDATGYTYSAMQEATTQVQTMGNKVKVTTDGDTTEYDDAETAATMMGTDKDDNGFTTESDDRRKQHDLKYQYRNYPERPDVDDIDMIDDPTDDEMNRINGIGEAEPTAHKLSSGPQRRPNPAIGAGSLLKALRSKKRDVYIDFQEVEEYELTTKRSPSVEGFLKWKEQKDHYSNTDYPKFDIGEAKYNSHEEAMDDEDSWLHQQKKEEQAKKKEDKEEVKEGYTRAELESALADLESRTELEPFNDRLTQQIKNVKQMIANVDGGNQQFNEGFGAYDDFNANDIPDTEEGIEWSTFDSNDEAHRKRLQAGTPVVLDPSICSDPEGDRTGIFKERSPSGSYAKVIRNIDGKEINVHLSDIVSADITNNSIYEEYGMNFDKLLAEDITMTQTTNLENPENDTTTVTAVGQDAGDDLAAMMANAGLNSSDGYAEIDIIDTGAEVPGIEIAPEPQAMAMGDMMSMMDAPPIESGEVETMETADADDWYNDGVEQAADEEDVRNFRRDSERDDAISANFESYGETEQDDEFASDEDKMVDMDDEDDFDNDSDALADYSGYNDGGTYLDSEDEFSELSFEDADLTTGDDDRLTKLAQGIASIPKRGEKRAKAIEEEEAVAHADRSARIAGRVQDRFAKGAERIHTRVAERGEECCDDDEEIVMAGAEGHTHANEPNEIIAALDAVLQSGGLNKPKRTYPKVAGGDNPMQVQETYNDDGYDEDGNHIDDMELDDHDEEGFNSAGKHIDDTDAARHSEFKKDIDEADDTFINEHESVDSFLNLYKKITEL